MLYISIINYRFIFYILTEIHIILFKYNNYLLQQELLDAPCWYLAFLYGHLTGMTAGSIYR